MKTLSKVLLLIMALTALLLITNQLNVFPFYDFVQFWSSGRLALTGGNPYDADQMLKMEQTVGWNGAEAIMLLNPPWVLSLTMFFGIFSFTFSRLLWFLVQICIICLCSILLWKTYNGNKRYEWMSWIALFSFGPMLQTLKVGQVTILVLLGSVGFLYFINKKSDFWAGVLASLVFAKPQLLYLFVVAVLIWSISSLRYRVLIGMAVALIASLSIVWIINPRIISQYIYSMSDYPLEIWMTSTLGAYLRLLLGSEKYYLQYIPSLIGVAWFLVYWVCHHKSFDWITNLPVIVLISLVTSAYGWTFDSAVCVLCVIQITAIFDFYHWTFTKIIIFTSYWTINLLSAFLSVSQSWFWWLPSFLLIWYLLSYHYLSKHKVVLDKPEPVVIS